VSAVEKFEKARPSSASQNRPGRAGRAVTDNAGLHLFLIRHGETPWSTTGQHTGRTDLPLTAHGEAQASELGRQLQDIEFSRVFASPLRRAMQTCAHVLPGCDFATEPDLIEWDYGDYEGKRSADIFCQRPGWDVFRDGCPHGESPEQVSARADRLIGRLRQQTGNVALFSHGHFGMALAARWVGLSVPKARHFSLDVASVSVFGFDSHHPDVAVIASWNRVSSQRFKSSFTAAPGS
jgi:broad specificity phosphatase PhoE